MRRHWATSYDAKCMSHKHVNALRKKVQTVALKDHKAKLNAPDADKCAYAALWEAKSSAVQSVASKKGFTAEPEEADKLLNKKWRSLFKDHALRPLEAAETL